MSENIENKVEECKECCGLVAGLRLKDAARYIGVSTGTFSKIINADPNIIPHYYSGNMKIFSKKALDNWLERPVERGKSIDLAPTLKR